ncbi:lysophospholipid acyltransferase family protein [Periweissella beninensis]|uniref:1-acyl-sn-glycerol-3-phosphate acyltransferase n=1 Tax=Periweissella beninensis TaxID=504936 RepID=A0ABT0VJF1_9LACO|nr:1-acyl-sn-glycerol-3-phosphate acyltransferase [Periweissella beninensis]MBM7543558.1 1-acyl-sn-glycerol-3-phosphate acyltransferase [Periweissella beninensis]MCM2436540.1 1-acyl-sn-glycerol-3-phosphate acyltransferase [Periweissella beninensis]MCT4396257.1 1-acyl-sn-glycerol-3-phosphate acyltransferase [Periweissella beninensis]
MFYSFIRVVARWILYLINGKPMVKNYQKLPSGSFILAGPHRTWWDPIYFALAAAPLKFSFMAKIELFKNPILRWILVHANAFPVDRSNPGPSVIKTPTKNLKHGLGLIMFPSGSRHSSELKSGVMMIAKLSGKPVVPIVYQGPVKFRNLFKRNNVSLNFGEPIYVNRGEKLTEENIEEFTNKLQTSFDALDHELDPNYIYIDPKPKN